MYTGLTKRIDIRTKKLERVSLLDSPLREGVASLNMSFEKKSCSSISTGSNSSIGSHRISHSSSSSNNRSSNSSNTNLHVCGKTHRGGRGEGLEESTLCQ